MLLGVIISNLHHSYPHYNVPQGKLLLPRLQSQYILSTHILPEVSMICKRVVIINEGRIVAEDTPEGLTGKDKTKVVLEIRAPQTAALARLRAVPGVASVSAEAQLGNHAGRFVVEMWQGKDVRDAIAQSIVAAGWSLLEMHTLRLSLEDVFIRLVTEEQGRFES